MTSILSYTRFWPEKHREDTVFGMLSLIFCSCFYETFERHYGRGFGDSKIGRFILNLGIETLNPRKSLVLKVTPPFALPHVNYTSPNIHPSVTSSQGNSKVQNKTKKRFSFEQCEQQEKITETNKKRFSSKRSDFFVTL